jgi:hypothetical protein
MTIEVEWARTTAPELKRLAALGGRARHPAGRPARARYASGERRLV